MGRREFGQLKGALLDDVVSYAHGGGRCFGRPLPINKDRHQSYSAVYIAFS